MRLLIISFYPPDDLTHGVGLILNNTLRSINRLGLSEVALVVSSDSTRHFHVDENIYLFKHFRRGSFRSRVLKSLFSSICSEDRNLLEKLAEISPNYDRAIWFGSAWDPLAFHLDKWVKCPLWCHATDSILNTEIQRSGHGPVLWLRRRIAKLLESRMLNLNYSGFIYVGLSDAKIARELISDKHKVYCLSNGIDTDRFKPAASYEFRSCLELLFVGVMGFLPNVDAMTDFMERIAPAISVPWRLRIVGRNPDPALYDLARKWPQVKIIGSVSDVVTEYQDADLFICPTRMNAGIKNKLLEAIACGLPTLVYRKTANNLDFIPEGMCVVDDHCDFAERINSANENIASWREAALRGREQLRRSLGWDARTIKLMKYM